MKSFRSAHEPALRHSRLFPGSDGELTFDEGVGLRLDPLDIVDTLRLLDETIDDFGESSDVGSVLSAIPLPAVLREDVLGIGSSIIHDEMLLERRDAGGLGGVGDEGRGEEGSNRLCDFSEGGGEDGILFRERFGEGDEGGERARLRGRRAG